MERALHKVMPQNADISASSLEVKLWTQKLLKELFRCMIKHQLGAE